MHEHVFIIDPEHNFIFQPGKLSSGVCGGVHVGDRFLELVGEFRTLGVKLDIPEVRSSWDLRTPEYEYVLNNIKYDQW